MSFDRLIAGAAAAALLAGAAHAQTSGSTTTTTSSPNGSGASTYQTSPSQPYASPPVTGGAAQPSAAGGYAGQGATSQGATGSPGGYGAQAGATGSSTTTTTTSSVPQQTVLVAAPGANIISTLQASGHFTKLLAGLKATNLTGLISTHPNLTLFAPTDAAFAALPPGQLDTLMKSPSQLQAVLTYHLVATNITASDLKGHSAGKVSAADNKPLTLDGSGPQIKVDDATVIQDPVTATNGVIFPIDKVLTPPA